MGYTRYKANDEKIEKIKEEFVTKWKANNVKRGTMVSYEHLAINNFFPKLIEKIHQSSHRQTYYGTSYVYKSENEHLFKIIPASELYKDVSSEISDKMYAFITSVNELQRMISDIKKQYQNKKEIREKTGQPFLKIEGLKIYQIKSMLANILFWSKSVLDNLSTLSHFLYGQKSNFFTTFNQFRKYMIKDKKVGELEDLEMKEYLNNNLDWFYLLKDIRDYITHYSSPTFELYEGDDGKLNIYMRYLISGYEIDEILNKVIVGLSNYMAFFDSHFSSRIE
jgi:hypothetical protein